MNIYEAFVYEWTNLENGMKYIGSHKGNIDDGYISSSKFFNIKYKNNPQIFTRKILAKGNIMEMRELETKLLIERDAAKNDMFYNKHNQNGKFICLKHDEKTKLKMKNKIPWNKGKKGIYSKETLDKMKKAKENYVPWNVGVSPSNETREKLSKYKGENHFGYGKKRPEHSAKMKKIWKERKNGV
jgi:NUMOD3 motif